MWGPCVWVVYTHVKQSPRPNNQPTHDKQCNDRSGARRACPCRPSKPSRAGAAARAGRATGWLDDLRVWSVSLFLSHCWVDPTRSSHPPCCAPAERATALAPAHETPTFQQTACFCCSPPPPILSRPPYLYIQPTPSHCPDHATLPHSPPLTQAAAAGGRGGDVDEADPARAEAGPGDAAQAGG